MLFICILALNIKPHQKTNKTDNEWLFMYLVFFTLVVFLFVYRRLLIFLALHIILCLSHSLFSFIHSFVRSFCYASECFFYLEILFRFLFHIGRNDEIRLIFIVYWNKHACTFIWSFFCGFDFVFVYWLGCDMAFGPLFHTLSFPSCNPSYKMDQIAKTNTQITNPMDHFVHTKPRKRFNIRKFATAKNLFIHWSRTSMSSFVCRNKREKKTHIHTKKNWSGITSKIDSITLSMP